MRAGITLDRPRPEDCEALVAAIGDLAVSGWLTSVPQPFGPQDAAQFVAGAAPSDYAIRVAGRLAGGLRVDDSLGIWLAPDRQGQGIGLRAAVLGLSRRFLTHPDQLVEAAHLVGNHRSAGLLARLGFRQVGPVTLWSRGLGRDVPAVAWRLSRADFAARHSIVITTPRLRIDAFRPDDLPDLHRIVTRPEVARMLLRFSSDMTLAEVAAIFTPEALTPSMRLVARHRGRVAGSVGVLAGVQAGARPSLVYYLDPDLSGQGLGQEMAAAMMAEYLARFDPPQMQAEVFDDNPTSARILRHLGFSRVEGLIAESMGRQGPAPAGLYRWCRDAGSEPITSRSR